MTRYPSVDERTEEGNAALSGASRMSINTIANGSG